MIEESDFTPYGPTFRTTACPHCGRTIDCLTHQYLAPVNEILRVPLEAPEAVYHEFPVDENCSVGLEDFRCPLCCKTVANSEEDAIAIFIGEGEEEEPDD